MTTHPQDERSTSFPLFTRQPRRPVSGWVERWMARLPVEPLRLLAVVCGIRAVLALISVLLAHYVTHETWPERVFWDGQYRWRTILDLVVLAPVTDVLLMMVVAWLVSWFSPLSYARATPGQTVIGVAVVFGALQSMLMMASVIKIAVGFAVLTAVYLRYRKASRIKAFAISVTVHGAMNWIAVVAGLVHDRCFAA